MNEKKTLAETLRAMDPRLIYALVLVAVLVPILHPIGLPVPVSSPTKGLYDVVQALPVGSHVWIGVDGQAGTAAESIPQLIVTVRHLFAKPVKIMFVSFTADGPMIYAKSMNSIKIPAEKKYGEDYVYMGFIPGEETGIASLADDIKGTAKREYFGTQADSLTALRDVKTVKDFDLVLTACALSYMMDAYVRQIVTRHNVKLAFLSLGMNYPEKSVYFPNQIVGILNGLIGAAEYENITGFLGAASSATDAFSMEQVLLLVLIAVANVGYFASKRKRRGA